MIAILAALLMAFGGPPEEPDLGGRIAASAAAAEAAQGPLDGAWMLYDVRRGPILALQITDPAGGGPLEAAWRAPGAAGAGGEAGFAQAIARRGARLAFRLPPTGGHGETVVTLRRLGPRSWRGWIERDGTRRAATLEKGPRP